MSGDTWWCVECGRPAVSNQYGCKCPNGPTASKLDPPLELDVEAAARSREKTRALLDSIELTPAQKKMAEAGAQYLKDRMKEGEE